MFNFVQRLFTLSISAISWSPTDCTGKEHCCAKSVIAEDLSLDPVLLFDQITFCRQVVDRPCCFSSFVGASAAVPLGFNLMPLLQFIKLFFAKFLPDLEPTKI